MNELNIGILLPTKENISEVSMNIIERVRNGDVNPLELVTQLAAIEKVCEFVRTGITENVLTELDKEQGKVVVLGAKIEKKETGVKYDYSSSEAWIKISEQEKKFIDQRKTIETIAKNMPDGTQGTVTDEDTGETWSISKASKSSKTSFAITLSK